MELKTGGSKRWILDFFVYTRSLLLRPPELRLKTAVCMKEGCQALIIQSWTPCLSSAVFALDHLPPSFITTYLSLARSISYPKISVIQTNTSKPLHNCYPHPRPFVQIKSYLVEMSRHQAQYFNYCLKHTGHLFPAHTAHWLTQRASESKHSRTTQTITT